VRLTGNPQRSPQQGQALNQEASIHGWSNLKAHSRQAVQLAVAFWRA
jgi:hypothetical protein